MRRIFRYEVPVDDEWHTLDLSGDVLHVASRNSADVVEVWAYHDSNHNRKRRFRVFGTGQPVPDGATYCGTSLIQNIPLVWHLLEEKKPE